MNRDSNHLDPPDIPLEGPFHWDQESPPPLLDLAAWMDDPVEDEQIESAIASDPELRSFIISSRLDNSPPAEDISPELQTRIALLVPASPGVLARIGGWSVAAAAAVLLAFGGWRLGEVSMTTDDAAHRTLSIATFGFGDANDETFFLSWNQEADR